MMGDAMDAGREMKKTFIVPAIKAFDHYDFSRSKIACSLSWLVAKAFGTDHVPEELREPFYTDQYEQEHIKPPVVNLLLSAVLYCRAGSLILKSDAAKPLLGHDAVVQALAQKGLYVTEQEKLVTERDLRKKPIQMTAHLAMIDTLMMAYTVEMISIEKVVSCVQQFTNFFPAAELPYDIEDAIVCWINKVNEHLKAILGQEQKLKRPQGPELTGSQRARYRKDQTLPKQLPCIPPVENLLKDTTDGCALAALIHFYCPDIIRIEDICMKETMSLADGLYNLQLIQEFCEDYLNQCCHFLLEDMLYASSSIKNNYLVFMAELFWWFEVVKPSFVQPRLAYQLEEPLHETRNAPATFPISNAMRKNFMETSSKSEFDCSNVSPTFSPSQPLLPLRHTQHRPHSSDSGIMRRSTSMSYVEGYAGTWPEKKQRSFPQAVSFNIPFDSDKSIDSSTKTSRSMIRSISNDSLISNNTPKHLVSNESLQPINGQSNGTEETNLSNHDCEKLNKNSAKRPGSAMDTLRRRLMRNAALNGPKENSCDVGDHTHHNGPPSIEEALQIIHDIDKPYLELESEHLADGFFLHIKNDNDITEKCTMNQTSSLDSIAEVKGAASPLTDDTEVDTGIHVPSEDIQETIDEDFSLRDYTVSMDSDMEDTSKPFDSDLRSDDRNILISGSNCLTAALQAGNGISPGSAIKMTSFAEQKFKKLTIPDARLSNSSSQNTTPESSELCTPGVISSCKIPELSPNKLTRDHAQLLASEMIQLKMKLQEKRRAIEAQKKKVEAAFTRQRQKMGRTAFLNVVRKKGDEISPLKKEPGGEHGDKSGSGEERDYLKSEAFGMMGNSADDDKGDVQSSTTTVESEKQVSWNLSSPTEEALGDIDIVEYNRLIAKMNTALNALQQEMQRLANQQELIMQMREQKQQQAWVISPPSQSSSPQKQVRELRSSSHSTGSQSPSLSSSGESPRSTQRSPQIVHRRSSYSHIKNSKLRPNELKITPLNRVLTPPCSVDRLPHLRKFAPSQTQTRSFIFLGDDEPEESLKAQCEKSTNEEAELQTEESEVTNEKPLKVEKEDCEQPVEPEISQMPAMPTENSGLFADTPTKRKYPVDRTVKASLIEVSLSELKLSEEEADGDEANNGDAEKEHFEEQKLCCGFFFKDDQKAEEIAMKRAALLEKRMRREKEKQIRQQQLEAELEEKKEEARLKAEEERQKKEDERSRREFIKQEYLRKKQLKLMKDMDNVIKPRPTSLKLKKARPRSFREDSSSPRTPVRSSAVSCLSLASLNTDVDSVHSGTKTPRTESVDGFVSPSCSANRNGEKDWENDSTTSSVASATDYTGPKLYKEPSAKSNKHIIQNAISHCCLAGKVNENQKNKILAGMENSEANNFLILFRDAGCQFRSLYTYNPETEEIIKLAGVGPKNIGRKMIEGLYKYNSDRKQFSRIPAKSLSACVDAIIIHGHLWQHKRPSTPKKLTPRS